MSQPSVTKFCHAQFRVLGVTRQERVEWCSLMIGREVDTTRGMTEDEWVRVADGLRGFISLRDLDIQRQPLLPPLGRHG
jgi:hypothetical protein